MEKWSIWKTDGHNVLSVRLRFIDICIWFQAVFRANVNLITECILENHVLNLHRILGILGGDIYCLHRKIPCRCFV